MEELQLRLLEKQLPPKKKIWGGGKNPILFPKNGGTIKKKL